MSACDSCLGRAHAISLVAPRIEGILQGPSKRIGEILGLAEQELLHTLVPAERLPEAMAALADFDPADARRDAVAADLVAVCRHHDVYPDALRDLADGPAVIWARGSLELLGELGVAVVGSRRASSYGLEVAEELGRGLAAAGVTVISGLALGIDGAAHRGALRAPEPRTIAVLGSGADVVYPRAHRSLYNEIAARGVVISEAPPGRRPFRWTFPARNRIMAALGAMTVVVEASDPSGSLITADFAADMNRAVGAMPGRVTSASAAGSNRLLREGAAVIRHAGDVLDELFGAGAGDDWDVPDEPALGAIERRILDEVERGAGAGALSESTGLDPGAVRAALGSLEMAGLIRRTGIGSYERRAGRHP